MEDIKKTYDGLFYKIALSRYDLKFISNLENFCKDFASDKDYNRYRIKARSAMSMIYYEHELFEKSFDLDLEFLQENSIEQTGYYVIIGSIAKTSLILMRTDEVKEYVHNFIFNGSHSLTKLNLLDWYASNYLQEISHDSDFEKVFSEINETLGAPVHKEVSLKERIRKLVVMDKDSSYLLRYFHQSYQQAAPELRLTILEEYIKKTPLKYYQDIMIKASKTYDS